MADLYRDLVAILRKTVATLFARAKAATKSGTAQPIIDT